MKIVIAGGTGFLGTCIINHYKSQHHLVVLTRGVSRIAENVEYVHWDGRTMGSWSGVLEKADVLINLNGKSVDCRYNEANKKLIYATRLESTAILGKVIRQCENPPPLWLNASSATIYRHALDRDMDEVTGEIGTGFSVDVCQKWEKVFHESQTVSTRKVAMRIAIVLGKNDGALKPLKYLVRAGLGGKQGQGNQYFSWIHEEDFVRSIDFVINNPAIRGVINVTSPNPVPNSLFMLTLRKTMGVPFGMPLPAWLLRIGAVLIGTETELILKSRRVVPKKLKDYGFKFSFEKIEDALPTLV